jgi:CheY-like chemotaxis protein
MNSTNANSTILIVEDKKNEREALARLLRQEGHEVALASDPEQAMAYLERPVDLIISDLRMGPNSGIDLLRFWKDRRPRTPFIMITAHGDVNTAVEAMKLGRGLPDQTRQSRRAVDSDRALFRHVHEGRDDSPTSGAIGRAARI